MAGENTAVQMSFSSGELDYPLRKRTEWARRDQGAEEILNGLVLSTGGTVKRPGMRFIGSCLHDDKPCTLIEFEFSPDQIYVLEFGDNIMRVYWDGGVVVYPANHEHAGEEFRISTPYTAQQATELRYAQDQDALFFAHKNVMPQRLTRYGHTDWRWAPMFADVTRIASPVRIDFVGDDGNGYNNYEYAVTAYRQIDGARQESIGYPTIQSLFSDADSITEAPQKTGQSCVAWEEKYKPRYGDEPGFPSVPAGIDLSHIARDQTAPLSSRPPTSDSSIRGAVNQELFDLLQQAYPDMAYCYNYYNSWISAPSIQIYAWAFRKADASQTRGDINYVGYVGSGTSTSLFAEWRPYVYGPNDTTIIKKVTLDLINGDSIRVGGKTVSEVHQEVMDFIESYNIKYGVKVTNRVGWPAVDGALGYYVYRRSINGEDTKWYRVADTAGTEFLDNIEETVLENVAPIKGENQFENPEDWPAVVILYQQRLIYAQTFAAPSTIFGSHVGIYTDFSINPTDDSSGFEFKLSSQNGKINAVEELVALRRLIGLTSGGEFINDISGAMTARNVNMVQQSSSGASFIPAIIVDDMIIRVPRSRRYLTIMEFSLQREGFVENDLTYFARHLLRGRKIVSIAYQRTPDNLIWAVLDDGELISCTFVPDQDILAWTRHHTNGHVQSVKAVTNNDGEDEIWLVVCRTLGDGTRKQYIEIFEDRLEYNGNHPNIDDAFYVDSGLSLNANEPVSIIWNLDHLEGLEVVGLADGDVVGPRTVVDGSITLDRPARAVHIGLPYEFRLRTLDLELATQGTMRDVQRGLWRATLDLYVTRELEYRSNSGTWYPMALQKMADWGEVLAPVTGDRNFTFRYRDTDRTVLEVRSTNPVPCGVLSILAEATHGNN